MADSKIDVTNPITHSSEVFVKLIDNGDSTWSIATVSMDSAGTEATTWGTNHLDDYTTTNVTYIGQESAAGVWRIIKIDETGNFPVFTYASVSNNATLTTYTLAWAARTTATYNVFSTAF